MKTTPVKPIRWTFFFVAGFLCMILLTGCGKTTPPDVTNCDMVGCAAPPLCSTGCQETCGCCFCTSGESGGNNLVCVGGCFVTKCTPGMDQTCNDDIAISSLHGTCQD